MSDYIPDEVWPSVLKCLPVKPLLQCTAVCKTWRSIITSSAFISAHLAASRRRPFLLTRSSAAPKLAFSLHSDHDPFPQSRDLVCPFPSIDPLVSFRVFAALDGLLCLSDDISAYTSEIIIWNPSIRRSVHLPKPAFDYHILGPYHFALGFGFDSSTTDYKLVRVVYRQSRDPDDLLKLPPFVEVFSLKGKYWRPVNAPNVEYVTNVTDWSQCFIHGAVHWLAFKRKGGDNTILMFDFETEMFKRMKLPQCLTNVFPLRLSVSLIGGLLAVLDREDDEDGTVVPNALNHTHSYRPSKINIWVKKGYGKGGAWTKIFTVDEDWQLGLALHLRELIVESSGDPMEKPEHGCDDLHLTTAINMFHQNTNPFLAFTFPESLVLLDKENGKNAHHVYKDDNWIQRYPEGARRSETQEESVMEGLGMDWFALQAITLTKYG